MIKKLTESQQLKKYVELIEGKPEFDSAEELSSHEGKPEFDSAEELSSHENHGPPKDVEEASERKLVPVDMNPSKPDVDEDVEELLENLKGVLEIFEQELRAGRHERDICNIVQNLSENARELEFFYQERYPEYF